MFFSAALFGFFGFYMGPWMTTSVVTGQFLFYVALFNCTLQGSSIACAVCGILSFVAARIAGALYAVIGLLGAASFLVIAVLDWLDPSTIMPGAPFLLVLFAAWNGYGSYRGLMELRGILPARSASSSA